MALTSAIGLRREPQPPMPTVIPSDSSAATSAALIRLSRMSSLQEGPPRLVGHAGQVQLEGEALLVAVAAVHVLGVDAVERLLGAADHPRVLGCDLLGQRQRGRVQL